MSEETTWQDGVVRARQYEKLVIHLESSLFNAFKSFECPSIYVLRTLLTLSTLSPHSNDLKLLCQSTHPRQLNLRAFDIMARIFRLLDSVKKVKERMFELFSNFHFSSPLVKARKSRNPNNVSSSDCEVYAEPLSRSSSSDSVGKGSSDNILSHPQLDQIIADNPWRMIQWGFKCSSSSKYDYQLCWNTWRPIVTLYLKTLGAFSKSQPPCDTFVQSALKTGGDYSYNIEAFIERVFITCRGSSGVLPVYSDELEQDKRIISCDILTESEYIMYDSQFIKLGLDSIQLRKALLCLGFDCFSDPELETFIDLYVAETTSVLLRLTYDEFLEWFTMYTASDSEKNYLDLLVRNIIKEYGESCESLWQMDSTSERYLEELLEFQTRAFPRLNFQKSYSKTFSRFYCAAQKLTLAIGYLFDRVLDNAENLASIQKRIMESLIIGDKARMDMIRDAKKKFRAKDPQDDDKHSLELCKLEKSIRFRYLDFE